MRVGWGWGRGRGWKGVEEGEGRQRWEEAERGRREKKKGSLEGGGEGNLYTNLCLLKWLTDLKLVSVCVYVDVHVCVNICILLLHVSDAHQQLSYFEFTKS